MPRTARIAPVGLVYHVTHRGNRRGEIFFEREDRDRYLRWLAEASERYGLQLWAYCLMTNHVHLLVRIAAPGALGRTLGLVQGRYAQYINRRRTWTGHLWANRFYSHPVEGATVAVVARYIERNPVRAGMTASPQAYAWSSARAHCGLRVDSFLAPDRPLPGDLPDWNAWIQTKDDIAESRLREQSHAGRPLGTDAFCALIELAVGRSLQRRRRGRPPADRSS
ncbi:MAG: transposase [Thermoanaerobaculia bacterium]|nr:transposase [Thermoanaerobaculia bacterium]